MCLKENVFTLFDIHSMVSFNVCSKEELFWYHLMIWVTHSFVKNVDCFLRYNI